MKHLYTYLPVDNTADTEGILSTRLAPKGWEKYIERSGKHTKEEVLEWLDQLSPGFKRSNAISVFTEPIPDNAHPDMVAFRDAKALYAIPEYKELVRLGVANAIRRIRTGNRRGTDPTSRPNYKSMDWEHIKPGKFLFSNARHYLVELNNGKVPAKYVKDRTALSRELMQQVADLAKQYKLPVFAVTDGASITRNNGNPGIKAAREALAKWEKEHGEDPDEDWIK